MADREHEREMLELRCDKCGQHWGYVPRPLNPRAVLDAFYGAIPEKFGSCMGEGKHGQAAAGVALGPDDILYLRGIAAAMAVISREHEQTRG